MKTLISAVAIAVALVVPVASFAQASQPVTRAQVRAELVQLEKAGYNPTADDATYPANIQAAQARVDAQHGTDTSGYGAPAVGTSQAGHAALPAKADRNSVYFGG
ncbi:DUF4148 domain-containing protein [Paraburkholderia sprentiae WSM5005]|uniref:DUF4148 domain-containing protein n=1 Tax=Paraburkholderia sprentiae WSM5005 TaxID=754502 RepID=A0A1I9YMG3_9BURK|nr:DUF4148 domain-containing protein [Paraburkholderia sprentiae]APA87496.1 DUF4148 domain-containing protein [Paraburkholderia sprentiae WSM5005]